jgi:hypothetical protein
MQRFIMFLEQILYTQAPKIGLTLIVSSGVSDTIQHHFLRDLVDQYWNTQEPPPLRYKAVYLYQPSLTDILFGWLYTHDNPEQSATSTTPCFIGHYLREALNSSLADIIFAFLSKGPVVSPTQVPPRTLSKISAPNLWIYEPQRSGVIMGAEERQRCYQAIQQGECVHAFSAGVESKSAVELNDTLTEELIQILMRRIGPIARILTWQIVEETAKIQDPFQRAIQVIHRAVESVQPSEKASVREELEQIFSTSAESSVYPLSPPPQNLDSDSPPLKWRGNLINL